MGHCEKKHEFQSLTSLTPLGRLRYIAPVANEPFLPDAGFLRAVTPKRVAGLARSPQSPWILGSNLATRCLWR
jgi:hypothetical protein